MKAVQISKPGGNFEVVERPIPQPGRGQVRIKVEACGICHSDALVKEGVWPGIQYPRVPGHEIAGRIHAVGPDVTLWTPGQRVGVGWHGGHCFHMRALPQRRLHQLHVRKDHRDTLRRRLRRIHDCTSRRGRADARRSAGGRGCSAALRWSHRLQRLRNSGARAGDLVAVQGIGGLGHLGIQYARQMGFRTVAIGRGGDKQALAKKLGAHTFIDTSGGAPAVALQKMGGARIVLATAPDSKSMSALVDSLAPNGTLMIVGADMASLTVTPLQLIGGRSSIRGWASGTAKDSQDTLEFSWLSGVRPMIERYPLEKAAEAYDQMISGRARFRVVLAMS